MPTDPDVVAALRYFLNFIYMSVFNLYLSWLKKNDISSITGNFTFDACSHGDFLGAILGTGIVREKVGDILLQVQCQWTMCIIIPLLFKS